MAEEKLNIGSPNMPVHNTMHGLKDEETSGSQKTCNNFMDSEQPNGKHNDRHTPHQVQELDIFFKECPHPNYKQMESLSQELGMKVSQVKFWFQNKRTQMKKIRERRENKLLRTKNEMLRAENLRYQEALNNASCPTCGSPITIGDVSFEECNLRMENTRLKEEIARISEIGANYVGKPF